MPSVLITGAGRRAGIAAACATRLAREGWDIGLTCWRPYDRETGPASEDQEPVELLGELRALQVRAELVEANLADPAAPRLSARAHKLPLAFVVRANRIN